MTGCPHCLSRRQWIVGGLASALAASAASAQPAPPVGPPLIDIHHHAIPDFWFEAAKAGIAAQVGGRIGPQWTSWSPESSLAAMDRQNVAMALLSISAPGVWFGDDMAGRALARRCNDALAAMVRSRPERFGFHATLALPDVEGSLREIDRAYDELKCDGVGLMTSYGARYLGDPAFTPVLEALNRRKAVVYVHPVSPACCTTLMPYVSPNFVEFLQDTNRAILSLMFSGALRRFRDISWIFSHAGGSMPMLTGRVSGLVGAYPDALAQTPDGVEAELRRLHYDVANSANKAAYSALTAVVPTSQVVFGTDFPIIPVEATAGGLRRLGLTSDDMAAISNRNALALYPQLAARMKR